MEVLVNFGVMNQINWYRILATRPRYYLNYDKKITIQCVLYRVNKLSAFSSKIYKIIIVNNVLTTVIMWFKLSFKFFFGKITFAFKR